MKKHLLSKDFISLCKFLKYGIIGAVIGLFISSSTLLLIGNIDEKTKLFVKLIIPLLFWVGILYESASILKKVSNPSKTIGNFLRELMCLVFILLTVVTISIILYVVIATIFIKDTYALYGIFTIASPIGCILGFVIWLIKRYKIEDV